ncbi:MAG: hypothetical protein AABY83_11345 [Pseudomonadota bacterium]
MGTENNEQSHGLWQIPKQERVTFQDGVIFAAGNYLFAYDGRDVTLLLTPSKNWIYRSSDDVYKLKTKWEGRKLFYLPPFGDWSYLAEFDGEQFYREEPKHRWKYHKIRDEDVETADKAILNSHRTAHDYAIGPAGIKERNGR